MNATLSEFLRTGRLGGLAFGTSRADARRLLGAPDAVSAGRPTCWRYGALELWFPRDRLALIGLHFRDPASRLPRRLGIVGWTPTRGTTFRQFRTYLSREGVPHRLDARATFEAQIALRAGRDVDITFDVDGGRTCVRRIQACVSPDDTQRG